MEIHFLRPYWFLAIIPTALLVWHFARLSLADNWRQVCDAHLLQHLLVAPTTKARFPIILLGLGSLLTIFSLAGPSWDKQLQPIYRSGSGSVLVLNLTPSMTDSVGTSKKIDRARFKLLDYLSCQREGLTGLLVYTDEAYIISPLTEDNRTIANFVPSLDPSIMPTPNDNTTVGLKEAGKLLKQAGLNQGNIILITDKISHFADAKQVASSLLGEGYRTYVFNISQSHSQNGLQELASAGGGKVINLSSGNQDVDELLAKTKPSALLPPAQQAKEKGMVRQDNGRVFVFFILPLALLAFRRGYLEEW